jgi:hypothetical protein
MDVETILAGSAIFIGVSDGADQEIEDAEPLWSASGAKISKESACGSEFEKRWRRLKSRRLVARFASASW